MKSAKGALLTNDKRDRNYVPFTQKIRILHKKWEWLVWERWAFRAVSAGYWFRSHTKWRKKRLIFLALLQPLIKLECPFVYFSFFYLSSWASIFAYVTFKVISLKFTLFTVLFRRWLSRNRESIWELWYPQEDISTYQQNYYKEDLLELFVS